MFNLKKKVTLISLFFCVSALFAQYNSGNWYIAKIKSGTIINQNELYGPYETVENTIAVWLYSNVKENSKYCICKNLTFTTSKPSTYYRAQYTSVYNDFLNNREQALKKYNVNLDEIVGKKSKNKTTEQKNETEIQPEITVPEVQIENTVTEETTIDTENKIEIESEQSVEVSEDQEIEKTEDIIEEPKPYTFEIDKSALVSRYKKEYLQDFVPEEKVQPIEDNSKNNNLIENPDVQDKNGKTLLMTAAKSGNDWQIKNLIESNADVNIQDNDGWTALMYAVRYQESTSIVKSLLEAKADVKLINNFDSSALTLAACYNSNPEILKLILDYYSISEKEVLKAFVLLLSNKQASEKVEIAKVNLFLQRSVPLNSLYNGKTPLMYSSQYGTYTSIIKMLLDNSALPGMRSSEGKTAFDYATDNKNLMHDEIFWSLNRK